MITDDETDGKRDGPRLKRGVFENGTRNFKVFDKKLEGGRGPVVSSVDEGRSGKYWSDERNDGRRNTRKQRQGSKRRKRDAFEGTMF